MAPYVVSASFGESIIKVLEAIWSLPSTFADRHTERQELQELLANDDRLLRDIGLTRDQVARCDAFMGRLKERVCSG